MYLQFRISFLYFLVFIPLQGINPHDIVFFLFVLILVFFSLLFQILFIDVEIAALHF